MGRVLPLSPFFRVVPDRYPDDPGRVAARVRLREVLASGKGVQGARVFPHELVEKLMKDAEREMLLEALGGGWEARQAVAQQMEGVHELSAAEKDVLQVQWESMRASVADQLAAKHAERAAKAAAESADGGGDDGDADAEGGGGGGVDLGKLVAVVDVSGSMNDGGGTPMRVAIALGT